MEDESIRAISSSVRFKDVAGIKDVKEELEEIIDFLKSPKNIQILTSDYQRSFTRWTSWRW